MSFRLAQPQGVITIDGMNANELDLHALRSRLSIIPQASISTNCNMTVMVLRVFSFSKNCMKEPVLFSGTVRYNLDPMDTCTDVELWNVLEKVGGGGRLE